MGPFSGLCLQGWKKPWLKYGAWNWHSNGAGAYCVIKVLASNKSFTVNLFGWWALLLIVGGKSKPTSPAWTDGLVETAYWGLWAKWRGRACCRSFEPLALDADIGRRTARVEYRSLSSYYAPSLTWITTHPKSLLYYCHIYHVSAYWQAILIRDFWLSMRPSVCHVMILCLNECTFHQTFSTTGMAIILVP